MARIGNTSTKKKPKKTKKSNNYSTAWQLNIIIVLILLQNIFLIYKNKERISDFFTSNNIEISSIIKNKTNKIAVKNASFDDKITKVKNNNITNPDTTNIKTKIDDPIPAFKKKVRVSVMNGCRVRGIAGKWKKILRKINFDVRDTGNKTKIYSKSIVISRKNDMKPAYLLAEKLGIPKNRVIQQLNKNIVDIDVELVIGKDYSHLNLPKN